MLFSKSSTAAIAMAGVANAIHLPTPIGSYYGNLRTTLTCDALDLVGLTLDAYTVALGPSTVEEGQSFYLNDVGANLTIPALISSVLGLAVGYVNARVFIELDVPNLSPSPLNTLPNGVWVNGTTFSLLQDTLLQAPQDGGVINHIGPLTATGLPGTKGAVYVHNATAELYLYGGAGELLREITLTCQPPTYAAVLATYNIVPSTTDNPPVLSLGNGYLVDYPPIQEQNKFICYSLQYDCTFGTKTYVVDASTCGNFGAYVETNNINSFTNSTTEVTLNSTQIAALKQQYPGAATFDYSLTSFIMNVTNAAPNGADGAPRPATTETYKLPSSGSTVITLPAKGNGLTFGPYTAAGAAGDIMYLAPGRLTSAFAFKDAAGKSVGSASAVCKPNYGGFYGPGANIVPTGATGNPSLTGL